MSSRVTAAICHLSVALVAALGGDVAMAADPPLEIELDGWIEVVSPSITLVTNLDQQGAIGLLESLEAQRATVMDLVAGGQVRAGLPTTIVLFADEPSYAPFRLAERDGQFFSTAFENLVILNGGSDLRPLNLAAAHEYSHALMAERGRRMPLWLHEGLAEYYSSFRLFDDRVVVGAAVPGHRSGLRNRAFLSFVEMAAVGGRSAHYHGESGGRFYAQAWLTVHYLMSDAERSRRLLEGLDELADADDPEAAYESAFGESVEALESALRQYLNRPVLPSFVLPRSTDLEPTAPHARSLVAGELAYRLGLVVLEQARWSGMPGRFSAARGLFEAAIERRPLDGDAYAGLARLEATQDRPATAEQLFERAVYLDALEPRSYAHYAELLLRTTGVDGVDERWRRIRAGQMLARALELEPGHQRLRSQLEGLGDAAPPGLSPAVGGGSNSQQ